MTVTYLVDEKGNKTPVQLSMADDLQLLESANKLPDFVKGIKKGQEQGRSGITKSTSKVMNKYNL